MSIIRKIIAVNMAAVILAMSLTACGSNDVENIPDGQDVPEITENTTENSAQDEDSDAAGEITSEPETLDVLTFMPETCEDYIKLANAYLQMDDVIQALAVLDEGIEKISVGEQDAAEQQIDLLSQRKEYILAGTVAVRTEYVGNEYDEEGKILTSYASERDENGNKIMSSRYDTETQDIPTYEYHYDANGNEIEYGRRNYDSDGNISFSLVHTRTYDTNGREIEYVRYDEDGNIAERKVHKYDVFGNETEYAAYNSDGACAIKIMQDYDERGNLIGKIRYDGDGKIDGKWEYEYDENENEIKMSYYIDGSTLTTWEEREYDENNNIVKYVEDTANRIFFYWYEYEYDENGNQIKTISYDYDGSFKSVREYEYDQNGRKICAKTYNSTATYISEYEYDEHGNKIKETETRYYNEETEQKEPRTIEEYEYGYDENENMTKYVHIVYDEEKGTDSHMWERKYDADGRETDFYLYINEKTVSYHSQKEYDENGRMISYTEYDKNGAVTGRKETEYDIDGNVIRESHYDADDSLIRCYEKEYDDFGSITRQAMYEDGVLKSEKQMNYVYRYIGDMDTEASDDFTRFLKGQKESIVGSVIVKKNITNLIDFSYHRRDRIAPQYTFLDMTGDGVEELIISYDRGELYVIQNVHGVLKVIFSSSEYTAGATKLVKGNGRVGICNSYSDRGCSYETYYFLDENGKKEISLRIDWDSEGKKSYCVYDNDSFTEYGISEGEYYDITDKMITLTDIDWQKLEDPNYGND